MILLSWWQWHKWKLLSRHITCQHFTVQSHVQTGAEPDVSGGWRESGGRTSVGAKGIDLKLNTFSYLTVSFVCNFAHECSEYADASRPATLTDRWGCITSSFPLDPPPSRQLSAVQITNRTWWAIITGIPYWLPWNFCKNLVENHKVYKRCQVMLHQKLINFPPFNSNPFINSITVTQACTELIRKDVILLTSGHLTAQTTIKWTVANSDLWR